MPKRELAMIAINYTIAATVERSARSAVDAHTDIVVEDNLPAKVGCMVVGLYVADKTKPFVAKTVDKIADSWQARKDQKKAAKLEVVEAPAA
jgi:hypothetical protein